MMRKLKGWALAALGAIAALFYVMFQYQASKRKDAEHKRAIAERNQQATQAQSDQASRAARAQAEARDHNEAARAARNEIPKTERRSGAFGTAHRLRNED